MEPALSTGQFSLVSNLLSLTIAAMVASGAYFLLNRQLVAPQFRPALVVSALVVFIAGYHYWRIHESWHTGYVFADGVYVASAEGFNDAYRYADWIITVPLLLVELVAVLGLASAATRSMLARLVPASVAMLVLGYPGEISSDPLTRWVFWGGSMVFFLYILYVLTVELNARIASEKSAIRNLIGWTRTVLLVSWWFYPLAYLAPMIGLDGAVAEVVVQVGYTVADISAKALFGLLIFFIAKAKSQAAGYTVSGTVVAAA